jgi:Zn-dependent protease with chaperone function
MRIHGVFAIVLVSLVLAPAAARGDETARRVAYDRQLEDTLAARDSAAARWFATAVEAGSAGDYATAAAYYAAICGRVPDFVHAKRRLAMAELALGKRDTSLTLMRQAVAADSSKENLSALATALCTVEKSETLSDEDKQAAEHAAYLALARDSTDADVLYAICRVGIVCEDMVLWDRGSGLLERHPVDESWAHYIVATRAADEKDFRRGRAELERARELGLPQESYDGLLKYLHPSATVLMEQGAGWTLGIWVVAFLALFFVGWLLSHATLARSQKIPALREARVTGADAFVRHLYAFVLSASCVFYYLSIPLLLVLVIGLVLGIIYAAFYVGHVPIKLIVLVVIVGFVTVNAIVRSLFVRGRNEDPGEKLDLAAHPRLRQLLDQVASVIGTRPVDNVYMTPGSEMAVMERGGSVNPLVRGKTPERCLILGAGGIDGMKLGSFKAILGHEYGHFSNRDTAGGQFALAVRRSLYSMAYGIAAGGAASWYNPAWLFLRGYHRVFLVISQGASRLQEVLADRWAVFAYGSEAFVTGLQHVIEKAVHTELHLQATLHEVIENKKPLVNLYAYRPEKGASTEEETQAVNEALQAKPTRYDSHPPSADRMAWARALQAENAHPSADDDSEVWTLFADREQIERGLTDGVRAVIHQRYGIEIPAVDGNATELQADAVPQQPS